MMRSSKSFFCLLFAVAAHAAMADGVAVECPSASTISADGLDRIGCQASGWVVIEQYLGPKPESPYASAFDRRELAVAYGKTLDAVRAVVGIGTGSRSPQTQSLLLQPPLMDYVVKRVPTSKARNYKKWSISSERIEYGAQGGAPGFLLECATAIRSTSSRTVVVAECFPLEERARFAKTLDAVR